MKPREVIAMCREKEVKAVDLRFVDFLGSWQHITIPVAKLEEEVFEDGVGFDGSSIRGWQTVNESDMLLVPVPDTAFVDPFTGVPTLAVICMVQDPITREDYSRDPRHVARKAATYLIGTGIADTCCIGPEAEFFIFDSVRFDQNAHMGFYAIDSVEAEWNRGREGDGHLGYQLRHRGGYAPVPPSDQMMDLRTEMMLTMLQCGIDIEAQHHEVASAGQCEIDMRYQELVRMADQLCLYKYIVRNVARRHGRTATFMPKPIKGDNGSGMHVNMSIWKDGKPLFAGDKYADLSDEALYFIGGILKHAKSLNAFTNPSTNSYKRLVPGYEAPVLRAYSARNRSGCVRIPWTESPKAKRVEARFPDPSSNPYLCFAALLMAGLDGIKNKIHPGEAMDKNLYDLPAEELAGIPTVCGSLREALDELKADMDYLLAGDVFTKDQVEAYIDLKMEEVMDFEMTPHPVEFKNYYSC